MIRGATHTVAMVVAAALTAVAVPAFAAPIPPPPVSAAVPAASAPADAVAGRVLALQRSVADLRAERVSIDNRLTVTSRYILERSTALDRANEALAAAQQAFNERAVAIYKFDGNDMLAILLDSSSFNDFMSRISVLSRVLDTDRTTLEEVSLVASEARDQAGRLEQVRAQDVGLRDMRETRIRILEGELAEQQGLLGQLTPGGLEAVATQARADRSTRARWKAASIPVGTAIRKVPGSVVEHPGTVYTVSQYHYRTYSSAGGKLRAVCSWYGADFNGRPTASGQTFNMDDFTCAHKTLPFGTWLALSRYDPRTKTMRRIVVVVNDRGPFVDGRDIDLSAAAADALGVTAAGVAAVEVEVVTPVR
jgi:hypothetical protein